MCKGVIIEELGSSLPFYFPSLFDPSAFFFFFSVFFFLLSCGLPKQVLEYHFDLSIGSLRVSLCTAFFMVVPIIYT